MTSTNANTNDNITIIINNNNNNHDSRKKQPQSMFWKKIHAQSSSSTTSTALEATNNNTSSYHTRTTTIIPPARSGAASVIVDDKLYIFGGYGGGTGRLNDFYSYSFTTQTWEEVEVLSSIKPGCRENNGVVIASYDGYGTKNNFSGSGRGATGSKSKRRIHLFGGYNGNTWLNDLWTFDIDCKQWICLQESSDNNDDADGVSTSSGINNDNENNENEIDSETRRSMQRYQQRRNVDGGGGGGNGNGDNHNGITHTIGNNKVPSRRFGYVSVVHNNKLILWGGFDGSNWLNDMHEFDFETNTWREVYASGQLPSVRSCPAWCRDDKHVYIQGGYDGLERKSDFYSCDLNTYTWKEIPSLGCPPSPRYFHSCCLYDNKMFCYGGYSGSVRLSDMYCYDFHTKFWSQIDCHHGDYPSGRSSLVAQVYENNLYVFGGYDGEAVLNDFYKFRLNAINTPASEYKSDMLGLLNNPELSDVTFLVEGTEVYANRAILATRSTYFYTMFYRGNMKESIQTLEEAASGVPTFERRSIEIPDVTRSVFIQMMKFIYTDSLDDITLDLGIQLLIASEKFLLGRLKAMCEDMIRQYVTIDNVSSILLVSHCHNANGLKEIALEVILENMNDPIIIKSLSNLKTEPDLLIEIIQRKAALDTFLPVTTEHHHQQQQQGMPTSPFETSIRWNGSRR